MVQLGRTVAAVQGIFAAHRHHHYAQAYGPPMVNCPGFALLRHDPPHSNGPRLLREVTYHCCCCLLSTGITYVVHPPPKDSSVNK